MKFVLFCTLASLGSALDSYEGGPTFDIQYASENKFTVTATGVPQDTWFGIAFGENMKGTDMVWFSATGNGQVLDLYGTAYFFAPSEDTDQSYTDVSISTGSSYTFSATRLLNTGDS